MSATRVTSSKYILQRSVFILFGVILLAALLSFVTDPINNSRCNGMMNDGYWLDRNKTEWQPTDCMINHYEKHHVTSCLKNRQVLYIGDSIMREQYYSMVSFVQPPNKKGPLHIDRTHIDKKSNIVFDFWWDPYINSSRTLDLLAGKSSDNIPSLLIMGTGMWHMDTLKKNYLQEWKATIDLVLNAVQRNSGPEDRIADAMILSPVEIPTYVRLNHQRQNTLTDDKITLMNQYLKEREQTLSPNPNMPFAMPFVWNTITTSLPDETADGLHFKPAVTRTQATLALNYRCNDMLEKELPMSATCCVHYKSPKWYQSIWFVFFFVIVPFAGFLVTCFSKSYFTRRCMPSLSVLAALFIFGLDVLYMYLCDRTAVFPKAHKYFDAQVFTLLVLFVLFGSLVSLKTLKNSENEKLVSDAGFLSRAQTDEWKGWMQMIILAYHYMEASGTHTIYNPVRILATAYLFQTGYGHFYFFYTKGDYSFSRILQILVRLNLLTFVLQYVMAANHLIYYCTPLVSFWFLVVWLTMYIGHSYNRKAWFLLGKIVLMSVWTTALIHCDGILESLFGVLERLFYIQWDAAGWRFRLAPDTFIVYIGMLTAYACILCAEHKLDTLTSWPHAKRAAVIVSCGALGWYVWFELSQPSKHAYNQPHPYISWIPILAYIVLRNATSFLRNSTSCLCVFVGKCSLETFIGKFHIWLAADSKALLVVLVKSHWCRGLGWWVNLSLSTVMFAVVCHQLNQATDQLTQWISAQSNTAPLSTHRDYQLCSFLPTAAPDTAALKEQDQNFLSNENSPSWRTRLLGTVLDRRSHFFFFILCIGVLNRFC